jgi:hypothetical protein
MSRSQSRRFLSALLSVSAVKTAFTANLRIGTSHVGELQQVAMTEQGGC